MCNLFTNCHRQVFTFTSFIGFIRLYLTQIKWCIKIALYNNNQNVALLFGCYQKVALLETNIPKNYELSSCEGVESQKRAKVLTYLKIIELLKIRSKCDV